MYIYITDQSHEMETNFVVIVQSALSSVQFSPFYFAFS